jgi:hypothetical protein
MHSLTTAAPQIHLRMVERGGTSARVTAASSRGDSPGKKYLTAAALEEAAPPEAQGVILSNTKGRSCCPSKQDEWK